MHFVTTYLKDGSKEHVGPFKSRQEGIAWAQAAINEPNSEVSNWSNERMYAPNLDILDCANSPDQSQPTTLIE